MPSWKKVIISGSDASLSSLFVANAVTASTFSGSHIGPLTGTASWSTNAINANTASYVLNAVSSSYATFAVDSLRAYSVAVGINTVPSATWYVPHLTSTPYDSLTITSSFTYNPITQILTVTSSRAVTASFATTASYILNAVSASWAGVASSSIVTHNGTNTSNFLIFTNNTGSTSLLTNTASNGIRYNPASNSLSSYTNDSTVKHQGSINFTLTAANSTFYPAFTNNLGGDNSIYVDQNGSYNYTPGTQTLAAGNFSGSRLITTSVTASFVSASSLISSTLTTTNITASIVSSSAVTASATLIGTAAAQAFTTTIQQSNISAGSTIIYSLPTASYEAMFFKYAMRSGSASSVWVQTGEIYTMRSGTSDTVGTQTSTANAPFDILRNRLSVTILNGNFTISGSFTSGSWAVRGIVQAI